MTPSVPPKAVPAEMRDAAKARLQETASIRVHRRLQARNVDRCNTGCASGCGLPPCPPRSPKLHCSIVRPSATTTRWHRAPLTSSAYLAFFSRRAFSRTVALAPAALVHAVARCAMRSECAAECDIDRQLGPVLQRQPGCHHFHFHFMSRSLTLHRTRAPASLQIRATVLSGPTALARSFPDCGQAARCRPRLSRCRPHTQVASVTLRGRRSLSSTTVLKMDGDMVNSGLVGYTHKTSLAPPPECDRK